MDKRKTLIVGSPALCCGGLKKDEPGFNKYYHKLTGIIRKEKASLWVQLCAWSMHGRECTPVVGSFRGCRRDLGCSVILYQRAIDYRFELCVEYRQHCFLILKNRKQLDIYSFSLYASRTIISKIIGVMNLLGYWLTKVSQLQ